MHMLNDSNVSKNLFILFDLDGTILDTDRVHYAAYRHILVNQYYQRDFSYHEFEKIINESTLQKFMMNSLGFDENTMKQIVEDKRKLLFSSNLFPITYISGMDKLIDFVHDHSINHAVVTNTNKDTVQFFKKQVSNLHKLTNWITREDYKHPKPNKECYCLALEKFYKNETNIIGFENSINGYNSLKEITRNIYIINDKHSYSYEFFLNEPVIILQHIEMT